METKLNTPLTADEIDFRVQSINKGFYATILAYKDARVDMNRLDAVLGVENWQKKYELIDGNLFCSVGIYNKNLSQWIWKQDVGTESMADKEKGQASDAFKRACFNLGIGRELYDYPIIQIKLNADEAELKGDKVFAKYGLKLKEWSWISEFDDKNKLVMLECKDSKGDKRFRWTLKSGSENISMPASTQAPKEQPTQPKQEKKILTEQEAAILLDGCKNLDTLRITFGSLTPDMQVKQEAHKNKLKVKLTPKTT